MPLDWSKLAPHRPLGPQDPLHVRRPDGGGEEIARWLAAGAEAIAVAGPVGSGKSTELAWAASSLQKQFIPVQIPLDKLLDMHRITEQQAYIQVATKVAEVARGSLNTTLSDALQSRINLSMAMYATSTTEVVTGAARDLLLQTLREVAAASRRDGIVLLVDGLEKCKPDSAIAIARALLQMRAEARIVMVAPFALVIGSAAHELISSVDRVHFLRSVPVRQDQGASGEVGRAFLREVARVRLDVPALPDPLTALLDRAADASGGVIRSFLQLARAASTYAALADRESMAMEDLDRAMRDHAESLERLLVEGDIEQIRSADGTSGVEIPEERRLRLLAHGLLLEYRTDGGGMIVHPAPLLARVLSSGGAA